MYNFLFMENNKLCSILSYLLVGIVWFFADTKLRSDAMVKFHTKQAMVLVAIEFLNGLIHLPFLYVIVSIGTFVLTIIGISNAWQGKNEELPLIGKFASKINL